ncbi:MAG: C13 family peptidase [Gemmataceae bacterium]|nr:C13 family peptidase [Gemmataceae bacterium]MCI0738495.1 C13 family peptidase [Gemmataceae bacterium]
MFRPKPRLVLAIVLVILLPGFALAQADEASRVRVLLVLDTEDRMGATWGLDGENRKEVLEAAFQKLNLGDRVTIDTFIGKKVTPENILGYYKKLKTQPSESLMLYYSGHGGLHGNKGHFLALHWGNLYRKDLLAAMKHHNPRLVVVMTDCCANLSGGTISGEPPHTVLTLQATGRVTPRAKVEEPPSQSAVLTKYEFALIGDGSTDVDIEVYDAQGQLVAKDDKFTDLALVRWVPKSTQEFTIKVRNLGGEDNTCHMGHN